MGALSGQNMGEIDAPLSLSYGRKEFGSSNILFQFLCNDI